MERLVSFPLSISKRKEKKRMREEGGGEGGAFLVSISSAPTSSRFTSTKPSLTTAFLLSTFSLRQDQGSLGSLLQLHERRNPT